MHKSIVLEKDTMVFISYTEVQAFKPFTFTDFLRCQVMIQLFRQTGEIRQRKDLMHAFLGARAWV